MTSLMQAAPTVKPTFALVTIVIKGTLYDAEPIPAGEFGVAAVRLTKRSREGETYDVILTGDGRAECDCPSFEFTHRGTAGVCKHGAACLAKGLLVAPVSGGSPAAEAPPAIVAPAPAPAFAPITRKDLVRSAYFGLRLPAAPMTEEAPAPVVVAEAEPEIPATNPRDSWPAWTDADTWELGPEASGLAGDESTGIDLTAFASTHCAVGEEVPSPVYSMPDLGGVVVVQPELVGLPPAVPPMAWVEVGPRAYRMVNLTPDRTDYPRAARRGPFVPTAEEEAEAVLLLADPRSSCLAGESSPLIGDRGVPRRATAWPRRSFDEPREADGYAPGYYS
jgi:hypothetical protein